MIQIKDQDVIQMLSRSILADGFDMVLDVEKSKGARLYDSKNNRTFIDFFSFFASNPLGINHPRMHGKAFEDKLLKFARIKVSNSDIYTTAYAEFVSSFYQNIAPMFDKFFFIEGGALGVENAIKTAQDWKTQKNMAAGRGEVGGEVMHFKEAFHGRTGYTMSLTNTVPEKVALFPKFDWPRISSPKIKFPLNETNLTETIKREEQSISEIKRSFAERPHRICAILIETIQAEGGDNLFRKEFHQKLRELADQNDALLIYDEVQTGMGLTGKFWAFENYDVMPDIIAFGKKVQVCGCAVRMKRLDEVENVFKVSSRINSTWGGNLVDMVRTTQFIDIIMQEKLLDHVNKMGPKIKSRLDDFAIQDSRFTNVRGMGLWMAFDLATPEMRNDFVDLCWKNGLIILPCGKQSVRLRPVLDLKEDEANEGLNLIEKTLKELKGHNEESEQWTQRHSI